MRKKTKTRALSLLLALVMVLGFLPGTAWAAGGTLEGEGTAEDPYLIADEADLAVFRDRVNMGEYTLNTKLTADIELSGEWTSIGGGDGYATTYYGGTFDGQGHTISNLQISANYNYAGFFGYVKGDAHITNLQIKDATITSSKNNVGGIAGTIISGTIENCSFEGSVTNTKSSSGYAGGIVGYVGNTNATTPTVHNCANFGAIKGPYAGGITAYAKFSNPIENCYNTGDITCTNSNAGGIAGQIANGVTVSNCYNTGTITATKGNVGGIVGFNGVSISNCYWTQPDDGAKGGSGAQTDCEKIADTTDLANKLGNAFTTDEGGNVILTWQAGADPVPKDPKITITGSSDLYMTNSGTQPSATLTVLYRDMEAVPVEWSIISGEDVITLSDPVNVDCNKSTQTVSIKKSGKATVKATAGEYSDEIEITVYPYVTTVQIGGTVAVGETVTTKINVLGGGEFDHDTFPEVKVQWKYLTGNEYSSGSTGSSSYHNITGATGLTYTIPEDMAGNYLSFTLQWNGEDKTPGSPSKILTAEEVTPPGPSQPTLPSDDIGEALEYYTMYPVCGTDTNVNTVLKAYLADKGFKDIEASVKEVEEVYGGAGIAQNGDITYFYADPNTAPTVRFGSYKVTFTLSKDSQSLEQEVPVIIYWDKNRVEDVMEREILAQVSGPAGEVTGELSLPKVVDNKRWALISWQSSALEVISISSEGQSTADTLFEPYTGIVRRGTEEREVTLTAKFTFQLANDVIGSEEPVVLYKTFQVTVPPMDDVQAEEIRQGLLAKLDAGFKAKGLTDAVTRQPLTADGNGVYTTADDIQLPTTRDFGVDGKYYPVTITTSSDAVLKAPDVNNAARVEVFRPGVGQEDVEGTITVTLHDRDTGVTASRTFKVKVPALTQEEIDRELDLMERVKASYFDGIKGKNDTKDNVRTDLSPFFEAYAGENGELVWVRAIDKCTGRGIVPVPMEGWEDLELWRLFKSSNPNVISHENLLVTRQAEAKAVTITSRLSSETLGRYGELYRRDPATYAQYAGLERLWYQEASTNASTQPEVQRMVRAAAPVPTDTIVVRGTKDPDSAVPVVEKVDHVTFSLTGLDGEAWLSTSFTGLDESSTVYDVFVKALGKDYTATRVKGTYIKAISGPNGSLAEKDHGENSGWMYRVNGRIPDVYMGACPVHSGDAIQVFYTRDAKKDDPNYSKPSGGNSGSSSGGKSEQTNAPSVKRSDSANTYTVTLPKDSIGPQLVTIPDVKAGQLVVIVHSDGREEVIKRSILENGRARFLLEQDATVRVKDHVDPFGDVPASAWYASAVDFAAGRELFYGVSQNTFAPDLPLSRGMLVTVLYRLESADVPHVPPVFADVTSGSWYDQGTAWAVEAGIVSGYGDGRFGPNDSITREQLAVMLFRYAQVLDMSTGGRDSLTGFSDAGSVAPWARDAVAWAVDSGIIGGFSDGTLSPTGTATRAQAAAMLQRFVKTMLK